MNDHQLHHFADEVEWLADERKGTFGNVVLVCLGIASVIVIGGLLAQCAGGQ